MSSPGEATRGLETVAVLILCAALVLAMIPVPDSVDMRDFDLITLAALSRW